MIPYSTQSITDEDIAAVCDVLTSPWLTQGPIVPRFEAAFAQLHGARNSVAVSSATAGLHLCCIALGVGPSARVWTSPISFVASANCAIMCGASVDFIDIEPTTRNLSIAALRDKLESAEAEGELPHTVIPVDFSGLPCDLRELRSLADRYRFRILEDASHAVGARYGDAPVGSEWADATVFSFHAVKIITTAEGGLVTTSNDEVADRLRLLRTHGITREPRAMSGPPEGAWCYEQQSLGFNYRLTDMQAALGLSQLARLSELHEHRSRLARRYDERLADLPLILPPRPLDRVSSHHLYVVEIDASRCAIPRADVFERMRAAGIGVNVHYIPIHLQPFWRSKGFAPGHCPNAEAYYRRALTIPLYPAMTDAEQEAVIRELRSALSS